MNQFNHVLTLKGRPGFIALNAANEAAALNVARMIAEETGCAVIVRDSQLIEIDIVPAPRRN
jgi:hypothetical protein